MNLECASVYKTVNFRSLIIYSIKIRGKICFNILLLLVVLSMIVTEELISRDDVTPNSCHRDHKHQDSLFLNGGLKMQNLMHSFHFVVLRGETRVALSLNT